MFRFARESGRIVVVDHDRSDIYRLLGSMPHAMPVLCSLPDGRSALRMPPQPDDVLWLINSRLPDIAGCELLEMLRDRFHGVPVVIVADSYSSEDELRACRAGATLYVCKPLEASVLQPWLGHKTQVRGDPEVPAALTPTNNLTIQPPFDHSDSNLLEKSP